MKVVRFLTVTAFLIAAPAQADFSFSCGEGRERGAELAEIGFVDSTESAMKFYLKGAEQPDEKTGIKATERNAWVITQDQGENGTRRFEFSISESSVQEFTTSLKGKDQKKGGAKKCDYKQMKAELL